MSVRRLIAVAYKETLQIWRDPRSLAIALLMPLMQMALLGYGVSLDIRHVPLCVHDEERSQLSRELIDRFVSSGWFSGVRTLGSEAALRAAVDRRTCVAAVVVPVDFSRTVATRGAASVQTIFDATDTNTTNIAIGYARGIVAQFGADLNARWQASHGVLAQTVGTVDPEPRVWFNEGLDSRNFVIPGVVAVILALVGAQLTSLTVAREWERGTMEQLISTPVAPFELMLGKVIPYFAIGFVDAAFCLLTTVYWFGVPFRGSLLTLIATTALFTLVVLGIGYLMSVRIRSQLGASQVALLLTMLPTTMLSGYAFAIEQMPVPIQAVTLVVYARYYVTILRSVFLKGGPFSNVAAPFAALALYALVIGWLSVRAFRKHLD
ncbi:ABC transporter permease [Burkholderia oklahomensis]|uniref:ABC-2 type transporter family protein n=1 Tax=Burkholderia oklahomensis TaxID=342113 RepID=A0AAI8FR86_9BURK|nr:ABC transporter permease [Burkholderia oklahomensis]AIO70471.1 ABC-2 type transporter family protein [Burkholderia oklahomensis]AOI39293.1 ABC transporter permease [Burkholderia oklahomensis EO147]KUY47898.1 ABC transporter permease [Burkholderia oklahomensis EO147]QPS40354.1 ABC transporter permease [Burkholderia oklahomensis]